MGAPKLRHEFAGPLTAALRIAPTGAMANTILAWYWDVVAAVAALPASEVPRGALCLIGAWQAECRSGFLGAAGRSCVRSGHNLCATTGRVSLCQALDRER